jgi:hypothetical protein
LHCVSWDWAEGGHRERGHGYQDLYKLIADEAAPWKQKRPWGGFALVLPRRSLFHAIAAASVPLVPLGQVPRETPLDVHAGADTLHTGLLRH